MAYRKTTKRYSSRSRKTTARRSTRRYGGRRTTRRTSGRNTKRSSPQTIRLVVEQVAPQAIADNGLLQTTTSIKKAAF